MLWSLGVTLIELPREQRGRWSRRKYRPGAVRKEHSLGQGGTGGEKVLGVGPGAELLCAACFLAARAGCKFLEST